ncbi:unnamed protein product [Chrysoparadoxa australica]
MLLKEGPWRWVQGRHLTGLMSASSLRSGQLHEVCRRCRISGVSEQAWTPQHRLYSSSKRLPRPTLRQAASFPARPLLAEMSQLKREKKWKQAVGRFRQAVHAGGGDVCRGSLRHAIAAAAALGGEEGALGVLEMVRLARVPPSVDALNHALHACEAAGGDWRTQGLLLLKRWQRGTDKPDDDTCLVALSLLGDGSGLTSKASCYEAVVAALAACGMHKEGLALVRRMKRQGVSPNEACYDLAIAASVDATESVMLLNEMRQRGMEPSEGSYRAVIQRCRDEGEPEVAAELLHELRVNDQRGVGQLRRKISKAVADEEWHQAMQYLEVMRRDGGALEERDYTSVIRCCEAAGQLEHAERLTKEMQELYPHWSWAAKEAAAESVRNREGWNAQQAQQAQQRGRDPFQWQTLSRKRVSSLPDRTVIDVHNMSVPSAVGLVTQLLETMAAAWASSSHESGALAVSKDLYLRTGHGTASSSDANAELVPKRGGRGSMSRLQPALVALLQSLDPPLRPEVCKHNKGDLVLKGADMLCWCKEVNSSN